MSVHTIFRHDLCFMSCDQCSFSQVLTREFKYVKPDRRLLQHVAQVIQRGGSFGATHATPHLLLNATPEMSRCNVTSVWRVHKPRIWIDVWLCLILHKQLLNYDFSVREHSNTDTDATALLFLRGDVMLLCCSALLLLHRNMMM